MIVISNFHSPTLLLKIKEVFFYKISYLRCQNVLVKTSGEVNELTSSKLCQKVYSLFRLFNDVRTKTLLSFLIYNIGLTFLINYRL